jgi:hypothetical protein
LGTRLSSAGAGLRPERRFVSTGERAVSRPTYNKEFFIPVPFDERGAVKQIAYQMQIENGIRVRFCVGYQVRDPYDARLKDIVRYDDARGHIPSCAI